MSRYNKGTKVHQPSAIIMRLDDGSYILGQKAIAKYFGTSTRRIRERSEQHGLQITKLMDIQDDRDFVKLGGRLIVNGQTLCSYRTIKEAYEENYMVRNAIYNAIERGNRHLWYLVTTPEEYDAYCEEVKKANETLARKRG